MKKIQNTIKLGFSTVLLAVLLSSCAGSSNSPADAYKDQSAKQIYLHGKSALQNKSYSDAVKYFEALDVQYPYGEDTESAQLYLIYAYYMKEDYILSVAAADRFIRIHPANPHVDYAYYMRGVSNYYQNMGIMERMFVVDIATRDLSQIQKSYNDFNQVTTLFPNSVYAPSAHQYMVYLRNVMANHELHIGEYYYNRKAYLASANRASELVTHFQGAPTTINGLVLMVKSYHQLGLNKLEQDTLSVLKYNYPEIEVNYNATYDLT